MTEKIAALQPNAAGVKNPSNSMPVCLYTTNGDGVITSGISDDARYLANTLGYFVPCYLAENPDGFNRGIGDQITKLLNNACDLMILGLLVDIQVHVFSSAHSKPVVFGWYRCPNGVDRDLQSILIIAVAPDGKIEELRFKPSNQGISDMERPFCKGVTKQ